MLYVVHVSGGDNVFKHFFKFHRNCCILTVHQLILDLSYNALQTIQNGNVLTGILMEPI